MQRRTFIKSGVLLSTISVAGCTGPAHGPEQYQTEPASPTPSTETPEATPADSSGNQATAEVELEQLGATEYGFEATSTTETPGGFDPVNAVVKVDVVSQTEGSSLRLSVINGETYRPKLLAYQNPGETSFIGSIDATPDGLILHDNGAAFNRLDRVMVMLAHSSLEEAKPIAKLSVV